MERLTKISEIGNAYYPKCFEEPCCGMGECLDDNCSLILEACKKLAEYEQLEEQGLLARLPCKVGDDVYIIPSPSVYGLNIINGYEKLNKIYHQHVGTIVITAGHWYATSREEYGVYNEKVLNDITFGATWFLTREEAEKKLEELENEI